MKSKLAPIALLIALLAPALARQATAAPLPSVRLKPILEPCLNAILAPLEKNPQMPRVKVETLRADFAASQVTASTPAQQQVYQNAMAVCDAMTSDMDARAKAQEQAKTSSQMSTLSTGGDIDESMPMHGWDAGAAGQAIRGKQKDDRADADQRAQRESSFVNSSAYTSWVNNAPNLREYVMNLYTRQTELEALYTKSTHAVAKSTPAPQTANTGNGGAPAPTKTTNGANSSDKSPVGAGTWTHDGKAVLWLSPDHTATRMTPAGVKQVGTWSVDNQGTWHGIFPQVKMAGEFTDDGKTLTTRNKTVYILQE
jgi:hypothetical protein